jgi:hypothetical protein
MPHGQPKFWSAPVNDVVLGDQERVITDLQTTPAFRQGRSAKCSDKLLLSGLVRGFGLQKRRSD